MGLQDRPAWLFLSAFTSLYWVPSAEWYRALPPSQGGSLNHPAAGGHQHPGCRVRTPWQAGGPS